MADPVEDPAYAGQTLVTQGIARNVVNMSKLLVAIFALSAASLTVGVQKLNLQLFESNPMIKLLLNGGFKGAYPGDDTDYDALLKALAALQTPITAENVKHVLKGHAPKLLHRVEAAEAAFTKVRDSIAILEAKNFVTQYFELLEKYWLVGMRVLDQLKEAKRMRKLYSGLDDEAKMAVYEKEKEALDAVVKALYSSSA